MSLITRMITLAFIIVLAACGTQPAASVDTVGTAVAQTVAAQQPTEVVPTEVVPTEVVPTATNAEISLAVGPTANTVTGQTTNNGAPARYQLDLPGGSVVAFSLQLSGENDNGEFVLTRAGNSVFSYDFYGGRQTISERRVLNSAAGGSYLLQIAGNTTYSLTVTATLQQDAGSEGDAGDSEATAREVVPGDQEYTGQLGRLDPIDYYRFRIPSGSIVNLQVQFEDEDIFSDDVAIIAGGEVFISTPPLLNSNIWNTSWALSGDVPEREYFLKITEGRRYRFTVTSTPQQDGGVAGDAGDSEATARELLLNQTITGRVSGHDPNDYYRLMLDQPTRLSIKARVPDQLGGNFTVALWNEGRELGSLTVYEGNAGTLTSDQALPAGEYFLRINGRGDYQVEFVTE